MVWAWDIPKDPAPPQALNNNRADERDKVLATEQQEGINADPESSLMQKVYLSNGG